MKKLSVEELKFYGEVLFGSNWHKSFVEAVGITQEQLTRFLSRDNVIPAFVYDEIKELLKWNEYKTKETINIINNSGNYADFIKMSNFVNAGDIYFLSDAITFEIIKKWIVVLEKNILDSIKCKIANCNAMSRDEAIKFATNTMIEKTDVSSYLDSKEKMLVGLNKNGQQFTIDDILTYRTERIECLKTDIEKIYNRI